MSNESEVTTAVAEYHGADSVRQVLVLRNPRSKYLQLVIVDGIVRLKRVPVEEERFLRDTDYSVAKAKRSFRRRGKAFGITDSARAAVRG